MNLLPYLLFISIFFLEYLEKDLHLLNRLATWSPEILSAAVLFFVLLRMAYTKVFFMQAKYIILFSLLIVHILGGIIMNAVPEGAIFAGIRFYFKFVPFFLLHAIYQYSDEQIKLQFKFLILFALLQAPVAIFQRFVQYSHLTTGDVVTGTLIISSILSIVLISIITVLLAFYLKKKISGKLAIFLSLILFFPAAINETKGTVILLPFAMFSVLMFLANTREMRKKILTISILCVVSGAIFVGMYDILYKGKQKNEISLTTFFTNPDSIIPYLYSEIDIDPKLLKPRKEQIAAPMATDESLKHQRRLDRIIAPVILLSSEPLKLIMGLGIGNVSPSFISGFGGEYAHLQDLLGARTTVISHLIWELGFIGVMLFIIFFIFILKDSIRLSKDEGIIGSLAAGWIGVVVIMLFSLPYKNILEFNVIGYLFWYFSGYIAARASQYTRVQKVTKKDFFVRMAVNSKEKDE